MKRFLLFFFISLLLVGAVFAQQRNVPRRDINPGTVEGTLKMENGFLALQSGETVYFVPRLMRFAGFIDGIREGANVSLEGFVSRNVVHPTKITVAGNSYDLTTDGHFHYGPQRVAAEPLRSSERGSFEQTRGRGGPHYTHGRARGHGHRSHQPVRCFCW
jgi:hypothetical protein